MRKHVKNKRNKRFLIENLTAVKLLKLCLLYNVTKSYKRLLTHTYKNIDASLFSMRCHCSQGVCMRTEFKSDKFFY